MDNKCANIDCKGGRDVQLCGLPNGEDMYLCKRCRTQEYLMKAICDDIRNDEGEELKRLINERKQRDLCDY